MRPMSRVLERSFVPPALRRADRIIAVSEHTRRDIESCFPSLKPKVSTIYPGVAPRMAGYDVHYLAKWGIAKPFLLFVGTLEPRKNLNRLLRAFAALPAEVRQQADLVIAGGEGWGDINLGEAIAKLSLSGSVHLTGYVDERELSTLYENALFLAMPSLYEGFGLPLVEAKQYGLPSLTATISSMPEVAGNAALLVNPLDVEAITDGLSQLISSSSMRMRLAAAARQEVARFDWDLAAGELLKQFSLK